MPSDQGQSSHHEDVEYEALKRWAKTADFPDPVRWGEVEKTIMAHPPPPRDQMDPMLTRDERWRNLIGYLMMFPVALVTFGASLVVLGFVIADVLYGWSVPVDSWLFVLLRIEFFAAMIISVFPFVMWTTTKRRGRGDLLFCAVTSAASFASFLLLSTTSLDGVRSWFPYMTLVAAVAGVATFVFMWVRADVGVRRPWGDLWRTVTPEEKWYRGSRGAVLEELVKRGLVSQWDTSAMMQMPIGLWHDLDEHPPPAWRRRGR